MGQYYYVCNLDKKEYLHPHKFGDGLKLLEFGCSAPGTMTGLAVLLATSNGKGGGDLRTSNTEIPGRWAGDRIAVVGDYSEGEYADVYDAASAEEDWRDISLSVIACLRDDHLLREELRLPL